MLISKMSEQENQKIIEELKKENELLRNKIEKLQAKVIELGRLVQIIMNPQIPSSRKIIKEKKKEPGEPKKPGAPIGHKGATRRTPEPNRVIDLKDQIPLKNQRHGSDILFMEQLNKVELLRNSTNLVYNKKFALANCYTLYIENFAKLSFLTKL